MPVAVSKRPFSYTDQKTRRRKLFFLLKVFVILFVVHGFVTWLLLAPYRVASRAMEPGISRDDLLLVTPLAYGAANPVGQGVLPGLGAPGYGDVVLANPPWVKVGIPEGFLDSLARFATFQAQGVLAGPAWEHSPVLKRVIALPGDTVYMKDSVFYVRSSGSGYFLSEFERSSVPYETRRGDLPPGYADWMPVSGAFAETTLKDGEYFVAGDDRTVSGDSRNWGPVPRASILAKAILAYWPVSRFRPL
jgi:signal peptidase I